MGTRADFYVGKGRDAEWIGSIAWDGDRGGIDDAVLNAHTEPDFRAAVDKFFAPRDDATKPDQGWPWPWDDSATSDCSYWFFDGRCWDARGEDDRYGDVYAPCDEPEPDWDSGDEKELYAAWLGSRERVEFPDMSARKNVTLGRRSGIMIFTSR